MSPKETRHGFAGDLPTTTRREGERKRCGQAWPRDERRGCAADQWRERDSSYRARYGMEHQRGAEPASERSPQHVAIVNVGV